MQHERALEQLRNLAILSLLLSRLLEGTLRGAVAHLLFRTRFTESCGPSIDDESDRENRVSPYLDRDAPVPLRDPRGSAFRIGDAVERKTAGREARPLRDSKCRQPR
ncbi:MAG: hypothetical protein JO000_04430 [Alphaproteobacteria bacterium]|nr:hypothetical protein [Alphaproteobacteria bacterium]